jgi:hypothetical protein
MLLCILLPALIGIVDQFIMGFKAHTSNFRLSNHMLEH